MRSRFNRKLLSLEFFDGDCMLATNELERFCFADSNEWLDGTVGAETELFNEYASSAASS